MDGRILLNDAAPTEYLTLDKKRLLADPVTRWRVADALKDAQSTTIYAKAYDKNPEFYAFLRSLDAYEKLMSEKSSLVVSTGSELFGNRRVAGRSPRFR